MRLFRAVCGLRLIALVVGRDLAEAEQLGKEAAQLLGGDVCTSADRTVYEGCLLYTSRCV